jgi:serine/threonine-protein kinase
MSAKSWSPGDVVMGKFRVDRVLGSGSMGVVLEVTNLDLGQRFAIKLMHEGKTTADQRERFLREARTASKLRSQHAVRVLDVGTFEAAPYMLMEHLDGRDLAAELVAGGPMPVIDAVEYVLQTCEAIAEAHAANVVHRDIKPANLFLVRGPGGMPCVKVLDFGISKVADSVALTGDAMALGSPLYMSPEQMRSSRDVDARSDIWALGVTLYELVAGRTPFHGEQIQEVCTRVALDDPPSLAALRPDLPAGLEAVIRSCLQKDRERRWSNVARLAEALWAQARRAARGAGGRGARRTGRAVAVDRGAARDDGRGVGVRADDGARAHGDEHRLGPGAGDAGRADGCAGAKARGVGGAGGDRGGRAGDGGRARRARARAGGARGGGRHAGERRGVLGGEADRGAAGQGDGRGSGCNGGCRGARFGCGAERQAGEHEEDPGARTDRGAGGADVGQAGEAAGDDLQPVKHETRTTMRTSKLLHLVAPAATAVALTFAGAARADGTADEAAAVTLFGEAKKLAAAGDHAHACPKFVEVRKVLPTAGLLLNLGDCYEHLGQFASSWGAFKQAELVAGNAHDPDKQGEAVRRALAIEGKLSKLTIAVGAGEKLPGLRVKRDGVEIGEGQWGAAVPVDAGAHVVEVSAPGYRAWSTTVAVGADAAVVSVAAPRLAPEPPVVLAEAPSWWTGQRIAGVSVGGVGVAGVIVGAIVGGQALSKNDASKASCKGADGSACSSAGAALRHDAFALAHGSTASLAVGGAAILGGVVLVLTGRPAPAPATARVKAMPWVGPGTAGLAVGSVW